jgi:hypothetical protein
MITRDELARRLRLATAETIKCARTFVIEPLPDRAIFHPRLVPNWDDDDRPVFDPAFTSYWERSDDGMLANLSDVQLVDELWHEGRAPEWVDLSVIDVDDRATHLEARFSRTLARYFDFPEPRTIYTEVCPFQIKGPPMPPGFDPHRSPREKFSINWDRE